MSWFDLSRVTQQVTRSSVPTDLGIALCESHAARFSVPDGWTLNTVDDGGVADVSIAAVVVPPAGHNHADENHADENHADENHADENHVDEGDADKTELAEEVAGQTVSEISNGTNERHRSHDRDNPWFVSTSDDAQIDSSPVEQPGEDWSLSHPTEGSLLHRAFHGPTSPDEGEPSSEGCDGVAGVASAPVDELSPRRRARSSADDAEEEAVGGYREFELPFPPHSPRSQRVAVS